MKHRTRLAGLVLVLISGVALAAACDSADDGTSSAGSGNAYQDCLAKNGVSLPAGNASGRPRDGGDPSGMPGGQRPSGGMPSGTRPSGMRPSGMWPSGSGGPGGPGGGDRGLPGVDASAFAKANKVCASLRPSGLPGGGNRNGGGGNGSSAYTNCLTEHGVTVVAGVEPNAADPTVAAAMQTCAPLRPTGSQPAPATS